VWPGLTRVVICHAAIVLVGEEDGLVFETARAEGREERSADVLAIVVVYLKVCKAHDP
jgi:hypothetical protein